MNLVDSSGWIEYFFDYANADYFDKPIKKADELIVPTICLYEVFKKVCLTADEKRAIQAVSVMKRGQLVELNQDIAISAAIISINRKLPMVDSIIYATARAYGAELWTQDEHMKDLPNVHYKAANASAN